MEKSHCPQVANLHFQNVKSLLSDLGPRACRVFYEKALESPQNFGFVDAENSRVRGFTLGTMDNSRLFRGPRLAAEMAFALLLRPRLLKRVLFHLSGHFAPAPEALYEAVDPRFRRQGIATGLYRALEACFRERGAPFYEVRIDASNTANLSLRQKLGAVIEEKFEEDGLARYRLVVKLGAPENEVR